MLSVNSLQIIDGRSSPSFISNQVSKNAMRVSINSLIGQLNIDAHDVLDSQSSDDFLQKLIQRFHHQIKNQHYEDQQHDELDNTEEIEDIRDQQKVSIIQPELQDEVHEELYAPVPIKPPHTKKFQIFQEDEDDDEVQSVSDQTQVEYPDITKNSKVTNIDGFIFDIPDVEVVPIKRYQRGRQDYRGGNKENNQMKPWQIHKEERLGKRNWKEDLELQMYDTMLPESNLDRPHYNPNSKFLTSHARKVDMPILSPWTDHNCPGKYSRDSRGMPTYCGAVPDPPKLVCKLPPVQLMQLPTIGGTENPEETVEDSIDWDAEYPFDIVVEPIFEVLGNVLPVDQYLTYKVLHPRKEIIKRTQMRSLIVDCLVDGLGIELTDLSASEEEDDDNLARLDLEERRVLSQGGLSLNTLQSEILFDEYNTLDMQKQVQLPGGIKQEPGNISIHEPSFPKLKGFNELGVPDPGAAVITDRRSRQIQHKIVQTVLDDPEFEWLSRPPRYQDDPLICTHCGQDDHQWVYCPDRFPEQCKVCLGKHYRSQCNMIVCFRCNGIGHRANQCRVSAKTLQQIECMRCGSFNHKYEGCMRLLDTAWNQKAPDLSLIKCVVCGIPGHSCDTHQKEDVQMVKDETSDSGRGQSKSIFVVLQKLKADGSTFEVIRHDYRLTGAYNMQAFDRLSKVQFFDGDEEDDFFVEPAEVPRIASLVASDAAPADGIASH